MASSEVDAYIERSEQWPELVERARAILLGCGLAETLKWGKPCYTHDGHNIVIVQEMKGFLALMFFKGALLDDPNGVLKDQGPNTRSARRLELTSVDEVDGLATTIEALVQEAIAVERGGREVGPPPATTPVDELQQRLDSDARFKAAFEALTPGRQREYHLYFSGAKRTETRAARIERYADKILAGKGMRDT